VPIDFAKVAAQFHDELAHQIHPLDRIFNRLEDAVKELVKKSEAAERATRAYPIFRYRDGALCVHVDPVGMALLETTPPLEFVEGLKAGGLDFLAGMGWVRTAVRQERAIPGVFDLGADAIQIVIASIDRFATPTPAMFDPRTKRLSDVFGLLVVGYNSLLGDKARVQFIRVGWRAGALYGEYLKLFPDDPSKPSRATVDLLVDAFETGASAFLDAVVLLPVLGDVLAVLVHDGSLDAKRLILTELGEVEAKAYGIRAAAIEGLIEGIDLGGVAAEWLFAARIVILADLDILTTAAPSLLNHFLNGLTDYADAITVWGQWITDVAEAVRSAITDFMSFDVLGFVIHLVIPEWILAILPDPPSITIDDLISLVIGEATADIRNTLEGFLGAASAALWLAGLDDWKAKVDALAQAVDIVLTPTPFMLPPDVAPTFSLAGFPEVYEAFFGGGRAATFLSSVDKFGVEARAGIRGALGGVETMLGDLGTTFATEADRAASMGSIARMRELAVDSAVLSERVFGPEADRLATRRQDELAQAFEDAVTSRGFVLIGNAIPAYVGELRRFWEKQRPRVEQPTSPHILARHGRLGVVRVPRLTVRARGRTPDAALAATVAARFHDAVGNAYVDGRKEFERLRQPPLRKPARRPSPRPVPERAGTGAGSGR
jgi:hypothetical protein